MTSTVSGPSFLALQVKDLDASAAFYAQHLGLRRAQQSPPGAVVFDTTPLPFAVRRPAEGVDLDSGQPGLGVALWLATDDVAELHSALIGAGVTVVQAPFPTPFGLAIVVRDPDGYLLTVHQA